MCIAFIFWQHHPHYRFFLALNRDEVLARPTVPVHWWHENCEILAGQDLLKGGTWFGCTKTGRIALITSCRETGKEESLISRGELAICFLKGSKTPLEYAFEAGNQYNGFNLLVADLFAGSMAFVSNRPTNNPVRAQTVMPGFHVLSNASLNTPWPKAVRGRAKLELLVKDNLPFEVLKERVLKEVLMDDVKADIASLPDKEHDLSSIFVSSIRNGGPYGTRSMIVFAVEDNLHVKLFERFLEDKIWKEHEFSFYADRTSVGDLP